MYKKKNSFHQLFFIFYGLIASIILILSPVLLGVFMFPSNSINVDIIYDEPTIFFLIIISMFFAFFGGALSVIIIRKLALYRMQKRLTNASS